MIRFITSIDKGDMIDDCSRIRKGVYKVNE